jgi:ankyrin repeat protein
MEDFGEATIDIVKLLVAHGADVKQKRKGPYPYALQAVTKLLSGSQEPLISYLLETGSDVNATGGHGTALQVAAARGDQSVCQLLIEGPREPRDACTAHLNLLRQQKNIL